ncbi:serine/threonine-protein kinase/endoribonuclease IRE1-like isoform X2 [Xenia sp. Carnegie-2017]|uniref:serine/threonine-protein kinase/endoribonuclease IRE1-like isoform X2 n=1 Tax=Xenia sp. Carnegie-2017 TaxID=2897299 RepID=UPI001F035543|nr:serine/threonine-protein kinase/endoribonuclease IRE1-like isoform X2 [Xenia sp. Carnegie-2017]
MDQGRCSPKGSDIKDSSFLESDANGPSFPLSECDAEESEDNLEERRARKGSCFGFLGSCFRFVGMCCQYFANSNDDDETSKITETSVGHMNDNRGFEDSDAMPSSVSHNDELEKVDQSSSSRTMKQHTKRGGVLPNITSLESDDESKMRAFEDVNVAKSAVPSKSEAEKKERRRRKDSNDDDEVSHNDELEKVDQSSSSRTMKQHTKRGGVFPNITSLESDDESKMRDVNVAKSAVPSKSEADSNDDDEASKIKELSECQLNVNDSLKDSYAMPSSGINDGCLNAEKSVEEGYVCEEEGKQRLEVQELLREPWKCFDKSIMHQEKFKKMEEYGRKHPEKVTLLSELRVIFKKEYLLGKGSDGTRVYLALGNDGYGKAVKRIRKDSGKDYANREKETLNELNAKRSNYVVNIWHLEENLDEEYLYMILDLCEESLEDYVESSSLQDLLKVVPKILIQILNGLAHLHSGDRPILHRDLRPSNVLRDVQGNFLIADFGISHILCDGAVTHQSIQRGAKNWIAPESYNASDATVDKVLYKKESDIMNAGMVAYYVATKGKHPFGDERLRLDNILKGNPVGLDEIEDATFKDLLSWMLQLKPEDRPSANEALKHPYLQSEEEKFNMLCDIGNQLKVKHSQGQNSPTSDVHKQLHGSTEWMKRIDDEVVKDLINFEVNDSIKAPKYESTWAGCLRFMRNVDQHWQNKPRPHLSQHVKQGNYKKYFLQRFPELPLLVHKVIRSLENEICSQE